MDEIDRTFARLKRKPIIESLKKLQEENKVEISADPKTFMSVAKIMIEDLENTGWSLNEMIDYFESVCGYEVRTEDDHLTLRQAT